jgi:dihydrolipoamide dehydrogenase
MDKELGVTLQKSLKKLGIDFYLETKVIRAEVKKNDITLFLQDKSGKESHIKGSHTLVCIGRKPYLSGLKLETVGIIPNSRGMIEVNEHFQTKIPNIYAIGDIIKGPMLAHKASEEGVACSEYIAGKGSHYNPNMIPNVVYTWPEVASVGKTEQELDQLGVSYKKGVAPFKASWRARAAEESDGVVKVLASKDTDEILGIHMIGPRCADIINEAVLAMEYRASAEDIGMIAHAHPTFSESLKEASLAATENRAIHF